MTQPRRLVTIALACFAIACGGDGEQTPVDAPPGEPDAPPVPKPTVVLSTTMGDMVVQLEPNLMPGTTANFLSYVDQGWYDGTLIHRVEDDWVIQGGGYTTGLAPKSPMDDIPLETHPSVDHVHGAISMARLAEPDTANSQWFIVDWPDSGNPAQTQLDGQYAAFGVVIEGLDVLAAITQVAVTNVGNLLDVPVEEIVVTSVYRREM